jgi:hypothetical protein
MGHTDVRTGLSRDTVKRTAYEAQRRNFVGASEARMCDHWFWVEEGLEPALEAAIEPYGAYLAQREEQNIDTRKVPEAVTDPPASV